jgi:hypothetical protein
MCSGECHFSSLIYGSCALLDFTLTLCRFASKSYLENILWTFIYFCAKSAKINERP